MILSFAPKISNTEITSPYQPSLSPQIRRTTRPRSERNEIRRGTWKSAKVKKYSKHLSSIESTWKAEYGIVE